jgi:dTDP-glucose 4,6-dehydratase
VTRALLTGAGGFVGSHVLEVLLTDTDWEIVAVDSFRHNGAFDRTAVAIHPGLGPSLDRGVRATAMMHDLAAPFSPRQLDQIGRLDYIINVASRCSVPESIQDPGDFVRNNVDSVLTVLELARQQWCWQGADVKLFDHRLVHLSTDEVYGPEFGGGATPLGRHYEAGTHRPSSPYAASKAAQEDLVYAWQRTFDIPSSIVTSANMFGERQSLLAFVPRVISAVLSGSQLSIHAWHGQPGARRYTYVRNTAEAILGHLHLNLPNTSQVSRVSLPGQHRVDNLALAQQIAALIGRPLRYKMVDGPAVRPGYDPDYTPLDGDAAWASIGFTEGLERTVKWFVDHPEWLK